MITSVTFERAIPVDLNRRIDRFTQEDGWSIVEIEPGRISLIEVTRVGGPNVIVQDAPYAICVVETPAAVEELPDGLPVQTAVDIKFGKKRGRP